MKIFKNSIFWALLGIVLIPVILKLQGIAQRIFELEIVPFAWIGLYWFVFLVALSIKAAKNSRAKLIYAYVSVLPLCLSLGEVWGYVRDSQTASNAQCHPQTSGTYNSEYFTPDSITGYKAKPNVRATSLKKNDDEVLYDVSYTSNDFGYRHTPNSNTDSKHCLLFFGDSFTIGEGVNDDQTLPYFLNQHAQLKVFNFGFHGYGNHQALALLKSGEVARITQGCEDYIAFYESLPGHIQRANGFSPWEDLNAPRFTLAGDTLLWKNQHKNLWDKVANKIFLQLDKKSYLFKLTRPKYAYDERYNALYFAILDEIDLALRTQFGTGLHFILWDSHDLSNETEITESNAITAWLENQNFKWFLVSEILPQYTKNRLQYGLHQCDTHPNALANELIAKFLAHKIDSGEIATRPAHTTTPAQEARDVE